MYYSIDRITGGIAMLLAENGAALETPVTMLPQGVREGDMLLYQDETFSPAPEKTEERRRQVANALAHLLGGGNG